MRYIVLVALLASCYYAIHRPPVLRDHFAQEAAAVMVESTCTSDEHDPYPTGSITKGSGVVVGSRHVLTALHVVECPYIPQVRVTFPDGSWFFVVVEREYRGLDVARLELATAEQWPIVPPIVAAPVAEEALCSSVVLPARGWSCGNVTLLHVGKHGSVMYTARTARGNSGSGVYDVAGNLVGIVTDQQVKDKPDLGGMATPIAGRDLVP
jgi:hypothetical protein